MAQTNKLFSVDGRDIQIELDPSVPTFRPGNEYLRNDVEAVEELVTGHVRMIFALSTRESVVGFFAEFAQLVLSAVEAADVITDDLSLRYPVTIHRDREVPALSIGSFAHAADGAYRVVLIVGAAEAFPFVSYTERFSDATFEAAYPCADLSAASDLVCDISGRKIPAAEPILAKSAPPSVTVRGGGRITCYEMDAGWLSDLELASCPEFILQLEYAADHPLREHLSVLIERLVLPADLSSGVVEVGDVLIVWMAFRERIDGRHRNDLTCCVRSLCAVTGPSNHRVSLSSWCWSRGSEMGASSGCVIDTLLAADLPLGLRTTG